MKIKKMLCWIFGHKSMTTNKYFPSIDAPIVTRFDQTNTCLRCGNVEKFTYLYDEKEG